MDVRIEKTLKAYEAPRDVSARISPCSSIQQRTELRASLQPRLIVFYVMLVTPEDQRQTNESPRQLTQSTEFSDLDTNIPTRILFGKRKFDTAHLAKPLVYHNVSDRWIWTPTHIR
jgi:hypothetical protein